MIVDSFKEKIKSIIFESYEKRLNSYNSPMLNAKKYIKQLDEFQNENININFSMSEDLASEFNSRGFVSFQSKLDIDEFEKLDEHISSNEFNEVIDYFKKFPTLINLFKNELESVLESIYKTHFYIFYGILSKKIGNTLEPTGSELWHSDGGPGTCINLMIVTSKLTKESGALELLDFEESKKLLIRMNNELIDKNFKKLSRQDQRKFKVNWINNHIKMIDKSKFYQPTGERGKVILFRNNTIHRGGFCKKGFYRNAFIFHIYPSKNKINWDKVLVDGLKKKSPIPSI